MEQQSEEMNKIKEIEAEFWREKFYEQVRRTSDLQIKVDRLKDAIKEYRNAAEFLSASGDNPLNYPEFEDAMGVRGECV